MRKHDNILNKTEYMDKVLQAKRKYLIAKIEYTKKLLTSRKPDQHKKAA
jgi:hypothetical protein